MLHNRISNALLLVLALTTAGFAQSFSTGSTGADGALDFPNVSGTVRFDPAKFNPPLNPSGDNIFNFTTIHIPSGVRVELSGSILHGPVIWLATGDVLIEGVIDLNGQNGVPGTFSLANRQRAMPGAGGFSGGVGGKCDPAATTPQPVALPGDGPLGGAAGQCVSGNVGSSGGFPGNTSLIPLVGGSGGGGLTSVGGAGQALDSFQYGPGGGAGGGTILIASPTQIVFSSGGITANGGDGGQGQGGGGAGGAIRLIAPTISSVHPGGSCCDFLSVKGGSGSCCPGPGHNASDGLIRLDTFFDNFDHSFNGPFMIGSDLSVFPPTIHPPAIAVTAINGVPISQPPTGSPLKPDVQLNTTSPVSLTIQANFIPPGTVITLHVFSDNNTDQTVQTTPLQGTFQSSTATATAAFPSGFSLNFVKATWSQ